MNAFSIGLSALAAGTQALDIVGQNIANASTPGYTRQTPKFTSVTYGGLVGSGVNVSNVTRYDAPVQQAAVYVGTADQGYSEARLNSQQQIQTLLGNSTTGISATLDNFFNQVESLASQPDNVSARVPLIASASDLAGQFNQTSQGIDQLRSSIGGQIAQSVAQINTLTTKIASLNNQIAQSVALGNPSNDLKDSRDSLIHSLAQQVDLRTVNQSDGTVNVVSPGGALVVGQFANQFSTHTNTDGTLSINQTAAAQPINFGSGSLAGSLQEYNVAIPATQARLNNLANKFIQSVNEVQASGLGTGGPTSTIQGSQSVTDPTALLSTQNLPIPLKAGNLVIGVTNTATGQLTNSTIAINPATQSLNDIAAAITAGTGGNVQGSVDPTTNTLKIAAQPGFSFDFAGRPQNPPNAVSIGGTSTPVVGGVYTGTSNNVYSFAISGSGTIGVTPGLTIAVRDQTNNVIATLNVGAGYAAGTPLTVGNGVTVTLTPGTTSSGSFSEPLIAYPPDTAGALPGMGIGGLFNGSNASDIKLNPAIQADPTLLAASRSGQPGDSSNLQQLAKVRDQALFSSGDIASETASISTSVGSNISSLTDKQTATDGLVQSLSIQQQSISGVDTNEELVHMLDYQRMIQASSKYMSVVNSSLDSLLNIIS